MAKTVKKPDQGDVIARIAAALERLAPQALGETLPAGDAFVWEPAQGGLIAVPHVAHVYLSLLKGIENQRDTLLANTERFAQCPQFTGVGHANPLIYHGCKGGLARYSPPAFPRKVSAI